MKIALAQINPVAGDLKGNALKITESITKARNAGCDLVVFPELSLTGAPLQGLTGLGISFSIVRRGGWHSKAYRWHRGFNQDDSTG